MDSNAALSSFGNCAIISGNSSSLDCQAKFMCPSASSRTSNKMFFMKTSGLVQPTDDPGLLGLTERITVPWCFLLRLRNTCGFNHCLSSLQVVIVVQCFQQHVSGHYIYGILLGTIFHYCTVIYFHVPCVTQKVSSSTSFVCFLFENISLKAE